MNDLIAHPVTWGLTFVIVITALQALGAWWSRAAFIRLAAVALSLREDTELTSEDKRIAASMMRIATAWYTTPALILAAPFIAGYVALRAIYLAVSGQGVSEAKLLGQFPKVGKFSTVINNAVWSSRPLVVVWGVIWIVPVLLVLALTHGSTKLLPALIERTPLAVFSRAAHH